MNPEIEFMSKAMDFYLLQKILSLTKMDKIFLTTQKISSGWTQECLIKSNPKKKEKRAESTDDLVENKIAEKIAKATSKCTCVDPSKLMTPTKTDENQCN